MPIPSHAGYRGDTGARPLGCGVFSFDAAGPKALLWHHSPPGSVRLPSTLLGLLLASATLLGGCVWPTITWSTITIESGAPLDPAALSRIRLGETTGTEVMRMLGPPHSIIRGSARFRVGDPVFRHGSGSLEYYSYARERQLSSLDDEHYALFYKCGKAKARSTALHIVGIIERTEVQFMDEELLIILDRARDVVTDVGSPLDDSSP